MIPRSNHGVSLARTSTGSVSLKKLKNGHYRVTMITSHPMIHGVGYGETRQTAVESARVAAQRSVDQWETTMVAHAQVLRANVAALASYTKQLHSR